MLDFRIGDRVTFNPDGQAVVTGMLTRYNKKTVTVITDDGHHWNVAPGFLKKEPDKISRPLKLVRRAYPTTGNVIPNEQPRSKLRGIEHPSLNSFRGKPRGISLAKVRVSVPELSASGDVVVCRSIRFRDGKPIDGLLCRMSGYTPPAGPR